MSPVEPLSPDALYRRCDPQRLDFQTTAELEELTDIVGQERASDAVRFGVGIRRAGFNVYALGPDATDKRHLVRHFVTERAGSEPAAEDLCYVYNFDEPHRPRALRLPTGEGTRLSADVDDVLRELQPALAGAFESEEYQTRRHAVQEEAGEVQQEAFEELQRKSRERDLALIRTPQGFVFAPVREGEVLSPQEAQQLSDEEREKIEGAIEELQKELQAILRQLPQRQREARERIRELDREVARATVQGLLAPLRETWEDRPAVLEHLDAIEKDIVESPRELVEGEEEGPAAALRMLAGEDGTPGEGAQLRRYRVNVIVDREGDEHAPVIYEDHPTYTNLVGRVEYLPRMGALVTDFNMIRAGALHRANGGYLLLDAHRVLMQPYAWEALKRALQSRELRIESPREVLGLVSTVSLDPEPVELDVKLVLLGDQMLYYLLHAYDPDFEELFKVVADFDDRMDREGDNERLYARLIGSWAQREDLRPLGREAVARVIERAARLADDAEKLSVRTRNVLDLLREADYWAGEEGAERIEPAHVQKAVDQAEWRSSRIRDRMQEQILRDTVFIDTDGEEVGQVNGLAVFQLGEFSFGRPSRITARVRYGKGEVVDIEREVELSGPLHSKGVLILSGFLAGRYARERPLSLGASLVFEQSYSGVDGDSASSTELYALLSAIAEVPLRQSVAVTGSVNQMGEVQPIGGVNEKIEGFFDVCEARGLTGEQGVMIPAANVKHLMLRHDVVDAVREGRFHVWAVRTVDEGMEVLTGVPMGEPDAEGGWPPDSINGRVQARLEELAERRKEWTGAAEEEDGDGGTS